MKKTIAIVEDEVDLAENYKAAFERGGFSVSLYHNRPDAQAAFAEKLPDLVIIDIGLGDEPSGGFDLCGDLRKASPTLPIIFLTARDNDLDAASGFRLGANDYLTKDISQAFLLVRVEALFKMVAALQQQPADDEVLQRGAATVNLDRMSVSWNGTSIGASVTEYWIIKSLTKITGHVKTRAQLMEAASIYVDDATINSHIKRIRKKIRAIDAAADPIEAVYGTGYRWIDG